MFDVLYYFSGEIFIVDSQWLQEMSLIRPRLLKALIYTVKFFKAVTKDYQTSSSNFDCIHTEGEKSATPNQENIINEHRENRFVREKNTSLIGNFYVF